MRRAPKPPIAALAALALFAAGLWLGGHPNLLPRELRDVFVSSEVALTAEVLDEIERDFYREVDLGDLERKTLKSLVRSLGDRFSHYLTPSETSVLLEATRGELNGVGVSVAEHRRGLEVVKVFEGSPAERAGLRKQDVIVTVDGRSIAGQSPAVATGNIKGRPGTEVTLGVRRGGSGRKRKLTIERAQIKVPAVEGELAERGGEKLAVVRLLEFTSGAHGQLREEIDGLVRRGAKGVVLDLRGNGGGLLNEAVLVASVFLRSGPIVTTRGRNQPEQAHDAVGDAISARLPVIVLVDRGSASAAEIVAGSLRARGRATLVGTRTFGKGLFQQVKRLSNGGALDLTVGRYYLPGGRSISKKGLRPQVRARDDPDTERDEALSRALDALVRKLR